MRRPVGLRHHDAAGKHLGHDLAAQPYRAIVGDARRLARRPWVNCDVTGLACERNILRHCPATVPSEQSGSALISLVVSPGLTCRSPNCCPTDGCRYRGAAGNRGR